MHKAGKTANSTRKMHNMIRGMCERVEVGELTRGTRKKCGMAFKLTGPDPPKIVV